MAGGVVSASSAITATRPWQHDGLDRGGRRLSKTRLLGTLSALANTDLRAVDSVSFWKGYQMTLKRTLALALLLVVVMPRRRFHRTVCRRQFRRRFRKGAVGRRRCETVRLGRQLCLYGRRRLWRGGGRWLQSRLLW